MIKKWGVDDIQIQNFWFYHRYKVFIGMGILFIGVYYLTEILGKEEPDYELALVCSQTVSDGFIDALEDGLERHLRDVNGDGTVVVRVNSYYFGAGKEFLEEVDADRLMGGAVQLAADLEMGISMVYITDDLESLNTGTEGKFQRECLTWKESAVLRSIQLPDNVNEQTRSEKLTDHLVVIFKEEVNGIKRQTGFELWELITDHYVDRSK